MNTFFKTFFVCLVLTFSFLAYKFFATDSYSGDLVISKNNPVFGIHQDIKEAPPIEEKRQQQTEIKQNIQTKYEHKCYFYSINGELVKVKRELSLAPSLKNSLTILFKGPTIAEAKQGMYSEIPANVDLIDIREIADDVIINLTSNFGNGGGSKSIDNRVKQLSKTAKIHYPTKKIYLYIDGKEVEYLGGDGVYVKQPLD